VFIFLDDVTEPIIVIMCSAHCWCWGRLYVKGVHWQLMPSSNGLTVVVLLLLTSVLKS